MLPAEVVTSSCEDAFMTGYYKNLSLLDWECRVQGLGFQAFEV